MTALRGRTAADSDGCRALLAAAAAEVPVSGQSEPLDAVARWREEQPSGGTPSGRTPPRRQPPGLCGASAGFYALPIKGRPFTAEEWLNVLFIARLRLAFSGKLCLPPCTDTYVCTCVGTYSHLCTSLRGVYAC